MTDRFALNMHDRLFDADATSQMTPLLGDPPGRTAAR
jgi:dGTPase